MFKKLLGVISLSLVFVSCRSLEIQRYEEDILEEQLLVLHISDIHLNGEYRYIDESISIINDINPDILLLTGDLIEHKDQLEAAENYLSRIHIDGEKYAVLGNWDYVGGLNPNIMKNLYSQYGFQLLINEEKWINWNGQSVRIYGMDDLLYGSPVYKSSNSTPDLELILLHEPMAISIIDDIEDYPRFAFAGHTHGGQITIFGLPFFLPPGSGPYIKGKYEVNGTSLFVSKGLGYSQVYFRIFARRDVLQFRF